MTRTESPPRPRRRSTLPSFLIGVIVGVILTVGIYLYMKHRTAAEAVSPAAPVVKMDAAPPTPLAAAPPPVVAPPKPAPPKPAAPQLPPDAQVQDDAAASGATSVNPPITPSPDRNGEPATN